MGTGASNGYSIDELMCVCISRLIEDGEMVAQGIATPLVAAGYLLAKHTHAPHIAFASVVGTCLALNAPALSLSGMEAAWIGQARRFPSFGEVVCSVLPAMHLKEFFRPAQVDPWGNTNNVAFGSLARPSFRLPGAGGIPDLTALSHRVYLYVPRHGRVTFVPRLDFRSGVGALPIEERLRMGLNSPGPRSLVSDLGCFDFGNSGMRVVSRHPGVPLDKIRSRTGFPLDVADGPGGVPVTEPPSVEEVRLLREVIDPLGVRTLEVLGGQDRWDKLRQIATAEQTGAAAVKGVARVGVGTS